MKIVLFKFKLNGGYHSVGRKKLPRYRAIYSHLQEGVVITTSHFPKQRINEAIEEGKNPISLIDGFRLSKVVVTREIHFKIFDLFFPVRNFKSDHLDI